MRQSLLVLSLALGAAASASELTVTLQQAEAGGPGAEVGSVRLVETAHGLALYPKLSGLKPGLHGFHFHANGSCAPAEQNGAMVPALGAGGHLDPLGAKQHGEPWGDGHLGDLPPLYVSPEGLASSPVLAPRLKLADVVGHALMVHAGGDNHADHPAPLGGGGPRVACGVVSGG